MREIEECQLKNYNSYSINSVCKKAYFPEREEDVVKLFCEQAEQKKIIIGNGNNIILSKGYYEEEFVIFNGWYNSIVVHDNVIEAEASATFKCLSELALSDSLSGMEVFYDIPSSVGGAVVMNAGAAGEEIKDLLFKVRYLDLMDKKIKEINKEDMDFEYRNSFFQKNKDKIVLKAWFKLKKVEVKTIKEKMDFSKLSRWSKQPREFPNGGSVFKRPSGMFVGPMIEELGLKGYTIGGAQISKKHGGFIINLDDATGEDILKIISHVQSLVMQKFGVKLEVEQRII